MAKHSSWRSFDRTRVFKWLAIALGFLPLLLIELILRLTFPATDTTRWVDSSILAGKQPPLFILDESGERYVVDPKRHTYFRPAGFAAEKHAGTRRVFVLGGSTVQGRPYANETAFAQFLELLLTAADKSHDYEVVNVGGVSYASYRVDRILQEVLRHDPDLIVLYTGHNEYLEDRTFDEFRSRGIAGRTVDAIADRIRTVTVIREYVLPANHQPSESDGLSPEVAARLDRAGGLEKYVRDTAWRSDVERQFESTFILMLDRCRRARVPVIACVPASDVVRTPPFKVAFDPGLTQSRSHCERLWATVQDGSRDTRARLEACRTLMGIDSFHAGVHYWLGRYHHDAGNPDQAGPHLIAARDHDVCPLRATSFFQEVVRTRADAANVPVIDVPKIFAGDGWDYCDPRWFVDHVHPTVAGHQRIAEALGRAVEQLEWVRIDDEAFASYQKNVRQHLGTLGEDYFLRGRQRLRGLQQWAAGRAGEPTMSP